MIGGHNETVISNSYYTYSILNGNWSNYEFKKNPINRELFTAVYKEYTSRIYIFGGYLCS